MAKNKSPLALILAEKKLTLLAFSKKIGVSERTVTYWSSGEYYPSLRVIFKVEKLLGKKIEEIFPDFFDRYR